MSETTIPNNVFVHCPKRGFKLSRAANCADCEHSRNLYEQEPKAIMFIHRYRVMCAFPIARRLEEVEI